MKEKFRDYLENDHKFDLKTFIGIMLLLVVVSGIFGWFYEFIFYFFNGGMKTFYWRGGNFLPFINIYAYGALLIYFFSYRFRKSPLKVFLISFIACGVLEFFSGWGYLAIVGTRCWDYNQEIWNFGNIGGFVCLRSVTFFGVSALLLMYVIIPLIFSLAKKMNKKSFMILAISLFSIFIFDELYNLIFARIFDLPRAYDIYHTKLGFPYVKFK